MSESHFRKQRWTDSRVHSASLLVKVLPSPITVNNIYFMINSHKYIYISFIHEPQSEESNKTSRWPLFVLRFYMHATFIIHPESQHFILLYSPDAPETKNISFRITGRDCSTCHHQCGINAKQEAIKVLENYRNHNPLQNADVCRIVFSLIFYFFLTENYFTNGLFLDEARTIQA